MKVYVVEEVSVSNLDALINKYEQSPPDTQNTEICEIEGMNKLDVFKGDIKIKNGRCIVLFTIIADISGCVTLFPCFIEPIPERRHPADPLMQRSKNTCQIFLPVSGGGIDNKNVIHTGFSESAPAEFNRIGTENTVILHNQFHNFLRGTV